MPDCNTCCSFQSHTCSLTACHTYVHTPVHTPTQTHTHKQGFSLNLNCPVSLSLAIFIPVICCQEVNNSFFYDSFPSPRQTAVCQTHTHTHSRQNLLMNSLGWIIASANQIPYYSCEFCILTPGDLFCVGGRGKKVAISFSSLFVFMIYHNLKSLYLYICRLF